MRPNFNKTEKLEFEGVAPKNQFIVSKIRDNGYMGVIFNKDEFLDAVVWATNIVSEYGHFVDTHGPERIVIPIGELPFFKGDLENAHFLLMVYYNMKKNLVLIEKLKQSLYTVARFQNIAEGDADMLKQADAKIAQAQADGGNGFVFDGRPDMTATEKKYHSYSKQVTAQIEKYREECAKAKL